MTHYKTIKPEFIPALLSGQKTTTIRPVPARLRDWPQPGDVIRFRRWTGKPYRSKQAEVAKVTVTGCHFVDVREDGLHVWRMSHDGVAKLHALVAPDDAARRDGFADWPAMRDWFEKTHGLPFSGILIEWAPLSASPA